MIRIFVTLAPLAMATVMLAIEAADPMWPWWKTSGTALSLVGLALILWFWAPI